MEFRGKNRLKRGRKRWRKDEWEWSIGRAKEGGRDREKMSKNEASEGSWGNFKCPNIYVAQVPEEMKPVNPKGNQPWKGLEGLWLRLKLQYSGHLMQRVDSLGKTLKMGKTEGKTHFCSLIQPSTLRYSPKRKQKHGRIQRLETAQTSINKWIRKQTAVCPYNGYTSRE